jgi:hypothetical protein
MTRKESFVAILLAFVLAALPVWADDDIPIPIQLESVAISLVNEEGRKVPGPVSVFLEVMDEDDIDQVCRMVPRIQDLLNIAVSLHPITIRQGSYDLGAVNDALRKAIKGVIKGNLIRTAHVVRGKRRIGQDTKVVRLDGARRGCRALEDYPPDVGIAILHPEPEPETVKEVIQKKDWFKKSGQSPPPPVAEKPLPRTIKRKTGESGGSFGIGFWVGVAGTVIVLAAAAAGIVLLLASKSKSRDRRKNKERRGVAEDRRKTKGVPPGPERRSGQKRRGDTKERRDEESRRGSGERRGTGDRRAKKGRRE